MLAGDASQCQDGQESIPLAECKGQVQGTDAAATSEQGTGASQPNAAPASDVDDLADLMHGLDPRGKAVIDADVSTHLRVALTSSPQYTYVYVCLHMYCLGATFQHFGVQQVRISFERVPLERRASVHHLC